MEINIHNLTKEEKRSLLKQLITDEDTKPLFQGELTEKIECVLKKFDNQLEEYFKEQDRENKRIHDNMWRTSQESLILEGIGKACARIKRILNEIKTTNLDECDYSVIEDIRRSKNRIIDNQLSDSMRGTKAYNTILRYEGQLADILEHIWCYAFNLGRLCRARTLTEDEIKKLDNDEHKTAYRISTGSYDSGRILREVESYINETEDARNVRMLKNMIPLNPDKHPEIMDFLKNIR